MFHLLWQVFCLSSILLLPVEEITLVTKNPQMKQVIILLFSLFAINSIKAQHQHQHKTDTTKKPTPKKTVQKTNEQDHSDHSHAPMQDTVKPKQKTDAHEGHDHHAMTDTTKPVPDAHSGHQHDMEAHDHGAHQMSHAFSRNLPMNRNGSGTAWLPDNSPMYGYMLHSKKWMYMIHGNLFLRYNKQDVFNRGERGDKKFDAPNMFMFMGQRNVGAKGLFHFSSMFSLDPVTVGAEGYPLLFQTGETYQGAPLVDRQHPHDLISELSVSYAHALSSRSDIFVYLGYPGEPALGPAAFVHRPSGFMNPDAPL